MPAEMNRFDRLLQITAYIVQPVSAHKNGERTWQLAETGFHICRAVKKMCYGYNRNQGRKRKVLCIRPCLAVLMPQCPDWQRTQI